jgi:monoamine oxidase
MAEQFDTIVIGAGLAGIAAAGTLTAAGLKVALVEARSRFGGRVLTVHDPDGVAMEMGPEWFDPSGPIHNLLVTHLQTVHHASGRFLRRVDRGWRSIDEVMDGGDRLHERLAALTGPDRAIGAALRELQPVASEAQAMLRRYVEGFHAADPDSLSLQWWNQVEGVQSADASHLRSANGLNHAVDALLAQVTRRGTVFLGTTARAVRWGNRGVEVDCTTGTMAGTLRASSAVVTLPLAVLRLPPGASGAVAFTPALTAKREAFERLATGPVVKLNLRFDLPFWEEIPGLDEMLFLQDFSQPIPTWWTARPAASTVLVGWAAGPQVARIAREARTPQRLLRAALTSLAAAMRLPAGKVAARLVHWHYHDWQRDPLAQGAYSWVRVGGLSAHALLAEPLGRALYFAGEATRGGGFNATMDGAIQSGWRAAEQLLADR